MTAETEGMKQLNRFWIKRERELRIPEETPQTGNEGDSRKLWAQRGSSGYPLYSEGTARITLLCRSFLLGPTSDTKECDLNKQASSKLSQKKKKKDEFGNDRGIAIRDKQTVANYRRVLNGGSSAIPENSSSLAILGLPLYSGRQSQLSDFCPSLCGDDPNALGMPGVGRTLPPLVHLLGNPGWRCELKCIWRSAITMFLALRPLNGTPTLLELPTLLPLSSLLHSVA